MKKIRYSPTWILVIDALRQFALTESNVALKTRIDLDTALSMAVGETVEVKIRAANYGCQDATTDKLFTLTRSN